MSEVADSVAISIAEDVMPGDSSLPEEASRMAIPSGESLQLVHSPQPQQQEITIDNHGPGMSMDELLEVIRGANGMPVLFAPSSDGRLAAVAVDGLQSLVPTNRSNEESAEKEQLAFRSWLLLLMSLVATVTFTAGLTPPGGFWAVADKANGYVAGTSVMHDKFPRNYRAFHVGNTTAFFLSLMVIGMLAKNKEFNVMNNTVFRALVCLIFLCVGGSYIAGTMLVNQTQLIFSIFLFLVVSGYMSLQWFLDSISSIQSHNRSPESMA